MIYKCDKNKIWVRGKYKSTNYSDGETVERNILNDLKKIEDLSTDSYELKRLCKDWVTTYHFSNERANILRPIGKSLNGLKVLEIGSGCGAISRYIGECGSNLTCLEGSYQRGTITRERTRDLKNVKVYCDKLEDFVSNEKYDIITLIGVLEYSNLFSKSGNEPNRTLKQINKLLTEDGLLIIAIENKLGLKYFSGYKEDHIGKSMYGIENRYEKDGVRTFGRYELENYLTKNGFLKNDFLFPFPDYKFPRSIITQEGLLNSDFDPSYIISLSSSNDLQKPLISSFEQIYTWQSIYKNKLVADLSNSFLIISGKENNKKFVNLDFLGFHYKTNRLYEDRKEIIFRKDKLKNICVSEFHINSKNQNSLLNDYEEINKISESNFIGGKPMIFILMEVLKNDNWNIKEVKTIFSEYRNFIYKEGFKKSSGKINSYGDFQIKRNFVDVTLWNIIKDKENKLHIIDLEFESEKNINFSYLLFRNIYYLKDFIPRFGVQSESNFKTWGKFSNEIFQFLGIQYSDGILRKFINEERNFQAKLHRKTNLKIFPFYTFILQLKYSLRRIEFNSGFEMIYKRRKRTIYYFRKIKNKLLNLLN